MNGRGRTEILGVPFDPVSAAEAVSLITDNIAARRGKPGAPYTVVTPNPVMSMACLENPELAAAVRSSSLSLADGTGIISAARRLRLPLTERVTGIDTGYAVLRRCAEEGLTVYLLGARPGTAELAAERLCRELPGLRVCGCRDGYFTDGAEDGQVIAGLQEAMPALLVVCLGSPRQELWVHRNIAALSGIGAVMTLGGALDIWSGRVKRAPRPFIRLRAEWLWRMLVSPSKLRLLPVLAAYRHKTRRRLL